MAIPLSGFLDSTESSKTIIFNSNVTEDIFSHDHYIIPPNITDVTAPDATTVAFREARKQTAFNELFFQRGLKPYYLTCGTASGTAAKTITGAAGGYTLANIKNTWPLIRVKFTNPNTVANPTFNINNTGAFPIKYAGSTLTESNAWILSGIVSLMFNGETEGSEYWDFVSGDTTTFTSEATAADNILHGTNSGSEITYAPYSSETADSTWVGTDGNGGKLYLGTVNPTKTNRLNLNGYLYAKKLYSDGTEVKVKQTAVSDPSADGNSTSFIATISQDTNGVITVTKKNLGTATTNTAGAIKVGAVKNSAITNASTDDTNTEKRYSVLIDSTGLAYINVPWTDTNTTYSSGNEITISNSNAINHNVKLSGGFTPTTTGATISGYGGSGSFKIPVLTVNDYGHVTNASEATVSITLPDNKITTYTAPTYDTAHVSPTYQAVINANAITTNMFYDTAINKLDNKIAGLNKEVIDNEAVLSQAIEDEPRYYGKSTTSTASTGTVALTATLVESRRYNLFNGTKLDIYFQNNQTVSTCTLNVSGSNGASGAHYLVYENALFDASLIEAGTTLALVYDSATVTIGGTNYNGVYRVVGGVGSGSSEAVTTQVINVNNPLGTYSVGDSIPVGTFLEEIIRKMLMVVIDVAKVNPSLTWSWNPNSIYEVGTTVTPTASGGTKTQGNYQSADTTKYTIADFIANNPAANAQGILTAGSDISASISYPSAFKGTSETSHTFTASYPYTDDTTVTPKKSDNTISNNIIGIGTATASKSCSYRYKYFVGGTAYLSNGDYSSVFTTKASLSSLTSAWCSTGTTTVGTVTAQTGKTTMILVMPVVNNTNHNATVTRTLYLGQDVKSNWVYQNTIPYELEDNTIVTYQVFAVHNGASGLQYTEVQFT